METLLKRFAQLSGLRTHHAAIRSDYSLEFDGFNPDDSRFHIESRPAPGHLEIETDRMAILQKNNVLENVWNAISGPSSAPTKQTKGADMTAVTGFQGLANEIRQSLATLKEEVSTAHMELAETVKAGNEVADQAKAVVKQAKAEIADAKAALGLTGNNGP